MTAPRRRHACGRRASSADRARSPRSHGRRPRSRPPGAGEPARTRRSERSALAVVHEDDRAARRPRSWPAGPNRAQPAPKLADAVDETWFWSPKVVVLPGHRNICIRGTPVPGAARSASRSWRCSCRLRPEPRSARSRRPRPPAAVVVRLEVRRRLVEAVAVEDVVERVAAVEQVRDNGVAIELRVLRQVGREVEVEPRTAVRAAPEVLQLVVVLVEIRVVRCSRA